ncbi:location of vulva defective 1 [Chironomus tepperi]|uniref:location of vulva defective 1 n=1 Tax=Chironomus tepperi TaxID=113505 RepID=UPI00391FAC57
MRTLISSLLVIAHITFTLSAPTPTVIDERTRTTSRDIMNDMITSTVSAVESIMDMKSTQLPSTLEKSPTTIDDDLVTTMTASIQKTTPSADESTRLPEMTSSTQTFKDNETIKIHENHESGTTRVKSTIMDQDITTMTATTVELPATSEMNNKNKSINIDPSTVTAIPITSNVDKDSVQSTIEMPISSDPKSDKEKLQKTKLKDTKKKILNDSKTVGKSWMQKHEQQKIKQHKTLMDINYSTSATPTMYKTDGIETTTSTAISTSIKTVPTTIKSTTLTSTMEMVTVPTTEIPIPVTLNANEMKTSVTTDVHVNNNNKDNVIVLNSNSSGLIVVDVMENFGKENSTNSFEIKMDLIDDGSETTTIVPDNKDEIFTVSTSSTTSISSQVEKNEKLLTTTSNDDIILVNEGNSETLTTSSSAISHGIKWNEVKHNEGNGDIKITFDNIDLPHQNVNVSIENGELIIDSIDISLLNRAEEELRKKASNMTKKSPINTVGNKTNSLEIVLVEDSGQEEVTTKGNIEEHNNNNLATTQSDNSMNDERKTTSDDDESRPATIHFELPSVKHKKIEMNNGESGDDIKIKTTDKDSDTIFYISNTEVKLIESIPTLSPNETQERKKYPAIYEEDVIVDVPSTTVIVKNRTYNEYQFRPPPIDKYEEDIVLSPLTSDFDPKDINYIGEAFLDVEESSNNGALSENHHIIPLTSDVVVQPVELKDMPSINIPIIGEPPQIELEDLMFSEDYENGNNNRPQTGYHVEYSPFAVNGRLVKNELHVDEQRDLETTNGTLLLSPLNRTHSISVNTVINGTNMTTVASPYSNVTAAITLDSEDIDGADFYDIQTLLLACLATLAPLFLCVIIALMIRYCWQKYRRHDCGNDLISDKSTDPLAEKHVGGSIDEMKSTESAMTLNRGNGNLQTSTELLLANVNGDVTPNNTNNHNDTNGSIIKMTMKNNHLIVETEERNDISRDTRETKMHYSPSEKDGVFIVESARGADQNGSHKPSPLLQKSTEAPLEIPEEIKIDTLQSHFTPSSPEEERKQPKPEQVEVHTPPADVKGQNNDGAVICNGTKTGLSQSDLSLTSSSSSNQNYTYGDRDSYNFDEKGYRGSSPKRIINVHCHDLKPLIENSPPAPIDDLNKPVITSAIYKNDSQEDNEPLKSDMYARNGNESNDTIKSDNADKAKVHNKMNGIISSIKNGLDEIISVPDENCNDAIIPSPSCLKGECNGELTMDSLSFLPAPPPEVDVEQNASELMSMDSFPPPPPLESDSQLAQS